MNVGMWDLMGGRKEKEEIYASEQYSEFVE